MITKLRRELLGSLLLAGTSVFALAASAEPNNGVETIIVTAEKRAEAAKDVPMSLTVVGEDELNKLNLRDFEDLAAQVPGLAVTEADPTHPSLILRGINAGGDGSTVGTYLDETPYGSSNALANGVDTAPNLDTFDMQRVEVLRGPQGTLYGAGTEGGLLKFVTNAPDTRGFDDAFELGGITMNHGGVGSSVRAMVNVALTDDLAVRAVGFDVRTPGYIDDPALNEKGLNSTTSFGGRVSILWKPTDKISVRLNAMQQQLDDRGDSVEDVIVQNGKISPIYGDYVQKRAASTPGGVRYYLYNATINWDLDFATLTSASSFTKLHDYTFGDDTAFLGAGVQGFLNQGRFIQEVRLASDPGATGPLDWLVGFYYANEHDTLHQDVVTAFETPPSFESLNLNSTYVETTGFANATYHVFSNFDVGAGLRYATDSQNSTEILTIPPIGQVAGGSSAHDHLTWSADARYHLDDNTMFYGRVATGWRAGGPNDLPPGAPPGVPRAFAPDSLTDYEVGVKSTLPEWNLTFDADVYAIEWRDIQLLEFVQNFNINGNGGRANSKGAEANVTWLPIDRLTLNLNASYNDAHLSEDATAVGGLAGNALPYSPKWSGTLSGDYEFQPIDDFTPYVGASLHYIGVRGGGFTAGFPELMLPDYTTFDIRVGVSWEKWSVELYGKNLNNAMGISAFAPYGGSAASVVPPNPLPAANASIIEPRIFGIVLRGKI
ncbi:MAG TPA: TonB-dependent receptor [Rhizomicrobium sp.]|nr:TonB-dependent receptor [Rhizomicrobium sp.]